MHKFIRKAIKYLLFIRKNDSVSVEETMEEGIFLQLLSLLLFATAGGGGGTEAVVGGSGTWSSKRYTTIANKHK
ncbi:hypothetical protein G6F42_028396 [Rhizopus arrhizus]|nr:hypothetical protein G6F42_028396 [Rhizopus arrhizus]